MSPSASALLVLDVQRLIFDRYGGTPALLAALRRAIDAAHQSGVLVIYVGVGFEPGHPEISIRNRMFAPIAADGAFLRSAPGTEIHPEIEPDPSDILIYKKRVSAFVGNSLELILRARGIGRVVVCGISTGGVVLSTVRQAADLDFEITVLSDGCADSDPEVHRLLLDRIFSRQADVATCDQWIASLTVDGGEPGKPMRPRAHRGSP